MFDGLSIFASSTLQEQFEANEILDIKVSVGERTGSIAPWKQAKHKGFEINFHELRKPKISGSILKYYNNGEHNYNDLYAGELPELLQRLCLELGVDPDKERITELEFGVNIKLPTGLTAEKVINSMLAHKGSIMEKGSNNTWYHQINHSEYVIKPYNKGQQYNLPDEVFRFEIKVLKMRYLFQHGINIRTLTDLLNKDFYPLMGKLLLDCFREILFCDPLIDPSKFIQRDKEALLRGMNKTNWKSLSCKDFHNRTAFNAARKRKEREEERFRDLANPGFYDNVFNAIKEKWEELSGFSIPESIDKNRKLKDTKCRKFRDEKSSNLSHIPDKFERGESQHSLKDTEVSLSQIHTLSVSGNCDNLNFGRVLVEKQNDFTKQNISKRIRGKCISKMKGKSFDTVKHEIFKSESIQDITYSQLIPSNQVIKEIYEWLRMQPHEDEVLIKIRDFLFTLSKTI